METNEQITKKLQRATGEALEQFSMIEKGDRIMVCLSGGKDSYTMLQMLLHFQKVAPISFEIIAVNLDQKQPGFPVEVLPTYLSKLGVNYKIIEKNTYKVVMEKTPEGKTTCSLCSRLRRGTLYEAAKNLNLITESGLSVKTYCYFVILIFPKIVHFVTSLVKLKYLHQQ